MEKQATLKDIAKKAGVSVATVSRVVNGSASKAARPEVQDRIWRIVKELNYIPNEAAQLLKVKDSEKQVGMVVCIFSRSSNFRNDPFFSDLARAIETELLKLGYIMKFSVSVNSEFNHSIEAIMTDEKIDGIIVLGRTKEKNIEYLKKFNSNIVCVSLNKQEISVNQVICDGYAATMKALHYLYDKGLRNISYLGEIENEVRNKAYRDFMSEMKLSKYQCIIESAFSSKNAYENLTRFLSERKPPEGIFCGNDVTAIGAIRAIKDMELEIPKDISLISIDDTELAQFSSPTLTTMNVPREQMGQLAARLIADKGFNVGMPMTILLPSNLVIRESC